MSKCLEIHTGIFGFSVVSQEKRWILPTKKTKPHFAIENDPFLLVMAKVKKLN